MTMLTVLTTQASSARAESIFSNGAYIFNKYRSRLQSSRGGTIVEIRISG